MKHETKHTVIGKSVRFLQKGIWELQSGELPWAYRFGVHIVRLGTLIISGFKRNRCELHAASLTFFSLMALIPILAMTLAMARSFGAADLAHEQFNKQLDGWMSQMERAVEAKASATTEKKDEAQAQAEVTKAFSAQVREISDKLFEQIDKLKFGTLGGIGAVMLLWAVIGMLGKVEASFNQIWGVEKPRTLVRKCADYLFVCMILPFLVTAASSVPVAAMVTDVMDKTVGGSASEAMRTLLASGLFKMSVTLLIGTLTFAFLLGFMPNTRVKLTPALAGGFVTVILFAGWLKLCAWAQIGIGKNSTLYGSFAVLPILLTWVYMSWEIVLLGAGIVFAVQNRDMYVLEQNAAEASLRSRLMLAVTLCAETARQANEKTGGPFAAEAFAKAHGIPSRFAKDILEDLVRNEILAEVAGRPGEYLLVRNGDTITVADLVKVILDEGQPLDALGLNHLSSAMLSLNQKIDDTLTTSLTTSVSQL